MTPEQKLVHAGRTRALWERFTWEWRWGYWGQDGVLSFSNHAYPVLVSVTVEIIPPGVGPVAAAHHLYTLLAALVVVGLPAAPVGVRERCAIAPRITYMMGIVMRVFFVCIIYLYPNYHPPGTCVYETHIILTSFCWVVLEAYPLAAAFAVQRQELFLLLTVDADQVSSSGDTVLMCCPPALLLGPVHIVEELQ